MIKAIFKSKMSDYKVVDVILKVWLAVMLVMWVIGMASLLYTFDENKLETLTKKMFGEQYTFSKMSEREKGMIKNEYNDIYR